MNFINRVNDGRLVYNENLYKSLISIFKPTYNMNDFILIGEMKPAKETDSSLHYLVKEIDESDSFYKLLSQGKYVSQETEGTYEQILEFQMYGAMTMLCKNKCIIKRGLRYTVYRRSCNKESCMPNTLYLAYWINFSPVLRKTPAPDCPALYINDCSLTTRAVIRNHLKAISEIYIDRMIYIIVS